VCFRFLCGDPAVAQARPPGLKPRLRAQVGSSRLPAQSTSSGLALAAGDLSPGGLASTGANQKSGTHPRQTERGPRG
jgi:hypothetical protein